MAKVQSYTKSGVDAKFNSRSNMTMVHNGGGSPNVSAYPDAKTGDVIERSSDGARWGVVASTASPIAGRVVSVAGKTGVVTLGPGDVGAAPVSHTHRVDQITGLDIVHDSTTAFSVVQRDLSGRITVATPTAVTHATTKAYVDSAVTAGKAWTAITGKPSTFPPTSHTHTRDQITDLPTVASNATNSTIVLRTSAGQVQIARDPIGPQDAASKYYVDTRLTSQYLSEENLNDVSTPGNYIQSRNERATTDKNYPPGAQAGHLVVLQGNMFTKQEYTDHKANAIYYRTKYNETWYAWRSITQNVV